VKCTRNAQHAHAQHSTAVRCTCTACTTHAACVHVVHVHAVHVHLMHVCTCAHPCTCTCARACHMRVSHVHAHVRSTLRLPLTLVGGLSAGAHAATLASRARLVERQLLRHRAHDATRHRSASTTSSTSRGGGACGRAGGRAATHPGLGLLVRLHAAGPQQKHQRLAHGHLLRLVRRRGDDRAALRDAAAGAE